jgi:hypothetical protein
VLTGELALPIGLHFAWDFVQGFVFGVTGGTSKLGSFLILAEDDPAAKLWTGFPYGVEGGPLATVAFILGFLLIAAAESATHRITSRAKGSKLSEALHGSERPLV